SLSPLADGSMPEVAPAGGGAPANGGGAPPNRALASRPPLIRAVQRPLIVPSPRTFATERAMRGSNLDAWYCNVKGQGPGAISPFTEVAFSGLVGSYPAAMIYATFHGGQSAVTVWQLQQLKVWSPICEIRLHGEWSRIQDHFSAAAHAGGLFW